MTREMLISRKAKISLNRSGSQRLKLALDISKFLVRVSLRWTNPFLKKKTGSTVLKKKQAVKTSEKKNPGTPPIPERRNAKPLRLFIQRLCAYVGSSSIVPVFLDGHFGGQAFRGMFLNMNSRKPATALTWFYHLEGDQWEGGNTRGGVSARIVCS